MPASGKWSVTVSSPMGDQQSTVEFTGEGSSLSGTTAAPSGESGPIYDASETGDSVTWKVDITSPMPMTLTFDGKISGNDIEGQCAAGAFGSFPFSGSRA